MGEVAWVVLDDEADRGGEPAASASAAVPVGSFDVYRYTMSVPPKKVPHPRNR